LHLFSYYKFSSKFSCARTKLTAIIKNVSALYTIKQLIKDMSDPQYYEISTDVNNHSAKEIFPLMAQHFNREKGMHVKLLHVCTLLNDISESTVGFCKNIANLSDNLRKCVAYGGNNLNTNIGGSIWNK
jgi:hypothetical protein